MRFRSRAGSPNFTSMTTVAIRRATVKTVTFHNPDNGWSVVKLLKSGEVVKFTGAGAMPGVQPAESLEVTGAGIKNATCGHRFSGSTYEPVAPEGREAVER